MAASSTDKFTQATNGSRPSPTTLTATKSVGAASITCAALTGWPTATAVHFIIYQTDGSGNKIGSTQTDWKGIVSGSTIGSLTLMGGTDQAYNISDIVEAGPTAMWAKDMADGALLEHNADGTHKTLTSLGLVTPKVTTSINDSNGNELIDVTATASAVNEVSLANAATGGSPTISAAGGDTNITVTGTGKGTGGFITKNPYKFSAYKTTNQTVSNDQKVTFDTENFDTGSNYDSVTNSRFVAPIAGFYQFHTQLYVSSAATSTQIMFKKNGSSFAYGDAQSSSTSSDVIVSGNLLVQLAATDYIEVFIFIGGGVSRTIQGTAGVANIPTRFEGYLVSV